MHARDLAVLLAPSLRALLGHDPLVFLVDLVAEHDKREVVGVPRAGLDQELLAVFIIIIYLFIIIIIIIIFFFFCERECGCDGACGGMDSAAATPIFAPLEPH
jgi:hypothetical protein